VNALLEESAVLAAYDRLATSYVERHANTLAKKPYDRARLDVVAGAARDLGPVLDLGCGPAHAARYLRDLGLPVIGLDGSAEMIRLARSKHPDLDLRVMPYSTLELPELGGLVALYSLVHLPRGELGSMLERLARSLAPGAPILIGLFDGEGTGTIEDLPPVTLYKRAELDALFGSLASLKDVRVEGRRPYPFEAPAFRIFVSARRD
jgi:SAM-dependent methyltransferase